MLVYNSDVDRKKSLILWFNEIHIEDVGLVGGKNASMGEMIQELSVKRGVPVPDGFAITAHAYFEFLKSAGIEEQLRHSLKGLNVLDTHDLETRGAAARQIIMNATFPEWLNEVIVKNYKKMEEKYSQPNVDVAVRSSATAEDLPNASFAGQQETFLNIRGYADLLLSCKRCMASLFTNRAISYRVAQGFDHFQVGLSICVQKMVRSDKSSSGVIFTIDTESGFKDTVMVTASWGLGENVVQGNVNPDQFYVFKPTLSVGKNAILSRQLGRKEFRMIYSSDGTKSVRNLPTNMKDRDVYCVSDEEVSTLAKWAVIIEDHYTKKRGCPSPMDIEWAKDGISGQLYIVQARPETVHSQADKMKITVWNIKGDGEIIARGQSVGKRIGSGRANIIRNVSNIHDFQDGDVLVTDITDPDWEPIMKRASGIVTNRGGRTCHAAIISRELGICCVVGCGDATDAIEAGDIVTVDCSRGEHGLVLSGSVPYEEQEFNLKVIPKTKTKVMMILGNPDLAFENSFLPSQGVGLLRMEFMVMNHIKAHPLAFLNLHDRTKVSTDDYKHITDIISQYGGRTATPMSGSEYFVQRLAEGIAVMAAAFYPNDVVLRFSDFKTNEYANLIGGSKFEPSEENPMLGWRGASRYYDDKYSAGFALECKTVLKVRNEMGLTNVKVMVPFCRTVEEGVKVLDVMAQHGLRQGDNGLKVYCMCEIPSNVLMAEEFLDIFDGFSIGSNDLTQMTLGVDRDSALVSHIYDERNPAVKKLLKSVIEVARRKGKYIGICGQAPSDYPEICEFLVREGIESISLQPDTIISTTLLINKVENNIAASKE